MTGHDLFTEPIVLGVSGGPDSLALLHLLRSIRRPEGLIVAHLDHGLRPGSAEEATSVAAAASGLRFFAERADVSGLARVQGLSVEEAGRQARYIFLADLARREGAAAVVVGHHADDQAETILMHFLRGSGLAGLAGMREAGPLPGHDGLWLVRPLLQITREEIEAYCVKNGLEPIIDASNADPTFFRNRLRHELLPLLESYNPHIRQRLRQMGEIVGADEELLRELTETVWRENASVDLGSAVELDREAWLAQPLALRRRALRRALAHLRPDLRDVGFKALEAARSVAEQGQTGATATLPGGVSLRVSYGKLLMNSEPTTGEGRYPQMVSAEAVMLPVPGEIALAGGWRLMAEWAGDIDLAAIAANSDPWTAYVDVGSAALYVQPRTRGERMRPLGLGGETKVKEIMIDRKIPAAARARWPIVATGDHPVWMAGHVVDDRARVGPMSGRIVRLQCAKTPLLGNH